MDNKIKKRIWTYGMLAFFILSMSVFAGFIGYGREGFKLELILQQYWTYIGPGIGGLLVIFILITLELFLSIFH